MKEKIIDYWIEKSRKSLKSAILEYQQGYLDFAVNRLYYAIFYITNAYFFQKDKYFKKHSGLRANFHKELVKKIKQTKFMENFMMNYLKQEKREIINLLLALKKNKLRNG